MHIRSTLVGVASLAAAGLLAAPATATTHPSATEASASATPAAAASIHVYQFMEARHSGKDLASENAGTATGTHVVQFTRNHGFGQEWEITSLPTAPSTLFAPDRQLRNRLSGKCLDVAGNSLAAGALVVQNPCDVNDPGQRWMVHKLADVFSPNGGYRFYQNRNSGQVLDIAGASTANQAHLIQFPKTGGDNQLFQQVFADASS